MEGSLVSRAFAHCRLPGLSYLPEDLALAHDHGVETGRDREEMADGSFVVIRVEQVGEIVGRRTRIVGEERAHVTDGGMEVRAARVHLGAVARREHDGFAHMRPRHERVQRLRQIGLAEGHPLEEIERN